MKIHNAISSIVTFMSLAKSCTLHVEFKYYYGVNSFYIFQKCKFLFICNNLTRIKVHLDFWASQGDRLL